MAKEIQLTQGKAALVDDDMYDYLNQWKWLAKKSYRGNRWCASRSGPKPRQEQILMHRVILDAPAGLDVDHIDGNALNNQRSNLRVYSRSENLCNRGKNANNKTGYKGVYLSYGKYYIAQIKTREKTIYLGSYKTALEAAFAYDEGARKYHGIYAKTNF